MKTLVIEIHSFVMCLQVEQVFGFHDFWKYIFYCVIFLFSSHKKQTQQQNE